MNKKWSYRSISKTIENSKIESRGELSRKYPGAYQVARRNGWLRKLIPTDFRFGTTIRNRFVWTKGMCETVAREFASVGEFRKECPGAYHKAVRAGWLKNYEWLSDRRKRRGFWSRERCLREALKYRTLGGLVKGCPAAYYAAHRNGWTGDFFWFGSGKKCRGLKWNFSK